jgi:hypothetical protein
MHVQYECGKQSKVYSHPELPKSDPASALCSNSVRVHLYAYLPHWKVLKHFLDVHFVCGNQSQVVYSLNRDIMHHFHLAVIQIYQNLFIYVQCGCGKQSKVVISLNNDIMASFPFGSHPELPKPDPASAVLWCKGGLICLLPMYLIQRYYITLYMSNMDVWGAICSGLQPQPWHHGIISARWSPSITKIWPSFGSVMV